MKRFEFSYRGRDDDMHFVVVYDDRIESACERVLCRPVDLKEVTTSRQPYNFFVTGWENTNFAIHEGAVELPSHHVVMLTSKKDAKVESILAGL